MFALMPCSRASFETETPGSHAAAARRRRNSGLWFGMPLRVPDAGFSSDPKMVPATQNGGNHFGVSDCTDQDGRAMTLTYLARIWQTRLLGEIFMATTTRTGMQLLLRHGNPRGLPAEYVDQIFKNFDARTRRAVLRLYRNTRETNDAMRSIADALRPLDLPAQVVWGAHDPYISVEFAERQREVFPRAEVLILRDSGHWPFIDNLDAVALAIVPFLCRQLALG